MIHGVSWLSGRGLANALIAMAGLFSCALHAADDPQVFTGMLGKMPIVVELDFSKSDDVSGRYFYQKYRLDLPLTGSVSDQELDLQEGIDDFSDKPRPGMTLNKKGNGWEGVWKNPQGKTFDIAFYPAQITPPKPDSDAFWTELYHETPYDYLRLQGMALKKGKQQEFMGYTLQWWSEPLSKISLFEIVSGYAPEKLSALNELLRARLWNEVISYHQCMLGASRFGGDYVQTVTPEMLTPSLVSVSIFTRYDCGGAHPDFGDAPLNIDVNSGQPLALEDVLWVGKDQPFHYLYEDEDEDGGNNTTDFDTFSNYREKEFSPWLVAQLTKLVPTEMKKPQSDEDCDYTDPGIWNFSSWYFTPKGIAFDPYFARVMRSCEGTEWSVLPYSVIRQHPGGVKITLPE
jgi:hypothetical protein